MHTQDFVLNEGSNGKVIEQIDELFPELEVVPPFAFIQETVNLSYILILMISPEHRNFTGVLDLIGHQ